MSDKRINVESSEWEEAIVDKAKDVFANAWDLALETEDEDLFEKVWNESARLVVDDVIASLITKGLVEVEGMTDGGDMTFGLTPSGDLVADRVIKERGGDDVQA